MVSAEKVVLLASSLFTVSSGVSNNDVAGKLSDFSDLMTAAACAASSSVAVASSLGTCKGLGASFSLSDAVKALATSEEIERLIVLFLYRGLHQTHVRVGLPLVVLRELS